MQVAKTACLYFLMCIYVADMEDSSRLEAVEDAVIGIQTSLRSIEAFTRNLSELQRGSQGNEEMISAIRELTAKTKSIEDKLGSSQSSREKAKSSALDLWIKVHLC